jgi:hypothetical protein
VNWLALASKLESLCLSNRTFRGLVFKMRHRARILASAIVIVVLLLVGWKALVSQTSVNTVTLAISTNAPKAYHSFFTAFLTNNTTSLIVLDPPIVQLQEESGRVLNNMAEIWRDATEKQMFSIPPNGVIFNSPQTDPSYRRLRVIIEYSSKANVIARFFSRGMRKINLSFLPAGFRNWMFSHGYVDGGIHGKLVSEWMVNPTFEHADYPRWVPASNPLPDATMSRPSPTNHGSNRAR